MAQNGLPSWQKGMIGPNWWSQWGPGGKRAYHPERNGSSVKGEDLKLVNRLFPSPRKLRYPLKRDQVEEIFIFQPSIFRGYISFQGGKFDKPPASYNPFIYSFYVILHVNCQFDAFYVLLCCQTIFETLNTSIEAFFMLNAWKRKTRESYIYRKKPWTTSGQLRKSQNTSQKISKTAKNALRIVRNYMCIQIFTCLKN